LPYLLLLLPVCVVFCCSTYSLVTFDCQEIKGLLFTKLSNGDVESVCDSHSKN